MYICMVLSEVILWLRVRVTSTHSADVITILRVFVESRLVPPLSSNVSSNIRRRVWCRFLFKSERFRNLITVCWVLYFEKTESLAESLINFQLNFSNYMFLMYVSKMKIKLYCMLKKKKTHTFHTSVTDSKLKCRHTTQCIVHAAIILEMYEPCSDR